jgi:hypothetical protein
MGPFRVVFTYELRPDPFVFRRSGFAIENDRRCLRIRVESNRSTTGWIRQYLLKYTRAQAPQDSFLESITLEAGEGTTPSANARGPLSIWRMGLIADSGSATGICERWG